MSAVRFLQLEPTTRCNFTCGFCAGRHMPQSDLSLDTLRAALDALPDVEHVELQGEGEPLIHPAFFDLLAEIRGRGIRVSFICNGSLLSPRNVDRLLDLGVEKISVSLESPDPEQFRALRGGLFDKVVRGVETLLAARGARGLDRPTVGLSVTVLRSTIDALPEIIALYRRLGLDGGVTLQPLQAKEDYAAHYGEAMRAHMLTPRQSDAVWVRMLTHPDLRAIERARAPVRGFFDDLMDGWQPASGRCPWLEAGLYVERDGTAQVCCMSKDPDRALGHVGPGTVDAVIAARDAMRDELARGRIPAPCAGCDIARFATISRLELMWWGIRGVAARLGIAPA
ncbi:MAG TPA: radical SAM protein [Myxococcota bacterium]|nr:radical SAM protein [Myxococcota bacterium]